MLLQTLNKGLIIAVFLLNLREIYFCKVTTYQIHMIIFTSEK